MDRITDFFKHTPLSKFIYPGILLLCAGCIGILFIVATSFLSKKINQVFIVDSVGTDFSIDLVSYKLVAQKLGLPEDLGGDTVPEPQAPAVVEPTSPSTATTTSAAPDKSALTIAVLNATTIRGLAAKTKDQLVAAGFAVSKTGNTDIASENSIALKESSMPYLPLLREALGSDFTDATVTTLPENASHDCVITLGKQ